MKLGRPWASEELVPDIGAESYDTSEKRFGVTGAHCANKPAQVWAERSNSRETRALRLDTYNQEDRSASKRRKHGLRKRATGYHHLICFKCLRLRQIGQEIFAGISSQLAEAVRKTGFTSASILAAISSAGMRSGVRCHRRAAPKMAQAAVVASSAESAPGANA